MSFSAHSVSSLRLGGSLSTFGIAAALQQPQRSRPWRTLLANKMVGVQILRNLGGSTARRSRLGPNTASS